MVGQAEPGGEAAARAGACRENSPGHVRCFLQESWPDPIRQGSLCQTAGLSGQIPRVSLQTDMATY